MAGRTFSHTVGLKPAFWNEIGEPPMRKDKLITIVIALIYLVIPVDILPEAVLGPLGLVDDATAIFLIIRTLMKK